MIYHNCFTPDCLPTEPIAVGDSGLRQAVPSRDELARAMSTYPRIVAAYELVCGLLAEARSHLAHTLPENWDEDEATALAVVFLGGKAALERLRDADHVAAKLR